MGRMNRTLARWATAFIAAGAITATTTLPAEAASTVKRTTTVRIGNPLSFTSTKWKMTTQSHGRGRNGGNYDRASLCLAGESVLSAGTAPWRANFRIYALNSRGRVAASRSGDNARFGNWGSGGFCKGLTVNRSRGAVRFVFRVNARDGRGERARSLSVRPR
jgi:hypothetical protein